MHADLPDRVPLVCLACRSVEGADLSVHTLALAEVLRAEGDDALDGILRCRNPACGHEYPLLDGVAIVHPDLAGLLDRDLTGLFDVELAPQALALLARDVPDPTPLPRHLEILSLYLDGHFADHATPPPHGPAVPGSAALLERIVARTAAGPVGLAVELGASVGRFSRELAAGAALTVALDQSLASLRRARRLLAGSPLPFARRAIGRHYTAARITAPAATGRVLFVCGDALDPPLVPRAFHRVVALNLLDVVHDPARLLQICTALVADGGELLLASPYAWQTGHVGEGHRLGGLDPAADVAARIVAAGLIVEEEAELPWALRRDDRGAVLYRLHYLRARRAAP